MATHLLPPPRDHHDDGLDQLLQRTAPPVAYGPHVDAHLQTMLQEARAHNVTSLHGSPEGAPAQPRRGSQRSTLRRRLALGAGAVVLAVSGASVAAANDDSPETFKRETAGFELSSVTDHAAPGRCAAVSVDLDPDRDSVDSPAYQAALAYLSTLDVEDIDPTQAYLAQRETMVTQVDDQGHDLRTVPQKELLTDEQLLANAYDDTVWQMLQADLTRQGLTVGQWSAVTSAQFCQAPSGDGQVSR